MHGLENWCRLCASEGNLHVEVFNKEREKCLTIAEELTGLCNIKLECTGNLPTKICNNCYLNFKNVRGFIKNCVQTQELFKELIYNQANNCTLTVANEIKCEDDKEKEEVFQNLEFLYEHESEENAQTEEDDFKKSQSLHTNDLNDIIYSIKVENYCEKNSNLGDILFYSETKNKTESHNIFTKNENLIFENNDEFDEKLKLNNDKKAIPPKTVQCDICKKNCLSKWGLKRHKDKKHTNIEIKSFQCNICKKNCLSQWGLKRHKDKKHTNINTNIKTKNFQCEICSQYYSNRGGLTIHMKVKHSIVTNKKQISEEFHCNMCGKNFVNQTGLTCHLKIKHSIVIIKDLKYKCKFCGKKFERIALLEIHENSHLPLLERKQLACPYCDKKFNSISGRWSHIHSIHDKRKTVICEECGKEFATTQHLAKHKTVHKQEKNIQCPHCPSRFKNKTGLTTHLQVHGDSYPCSICGSVLNTKILLRRHMIVHSNVKNFKCNFCNKDFKRLEGLNYHLAKHICVNTFECPICYQKFNLDLSCRRHIKIRHPLEYSKMFNDDGLSEANSLSSQLRAINNAVKNS